VFVGSQNEQLTYPAGGQGWKITGANEENAHSSDFSPFGRRLDTPKASTEREDAASDDVMRHLAGRMLSQDSSLCDASVDSPCKTCIEKEDPWCSNGWDKFCKTGCDGPTTYMTNGCKEECSEAGIVSVKAKKVAEIEKETPVDCKVSADWTEYSSCKFLGVLGKTTDPICLDDRNCGCRQKWTREIITQPAHGGAVCPMLEEMRDCECAAVCGDGHLVEGEECDDGNKKSGDGCNSNCEKETGWACTGGNSFTPSTCVASQCGDGTRSGTEQCDDGNNVSGDGCSSTCETEQWFDCSGGIGATTVCECMRVRKDWRDMQKEEQNLYIEGVQALKASGQYDMIVQTHADLGNKAYAHGTSGFLPWHRKYLMEFENMLRAADGNANGKFKCLAVPYWDWAEDTDICSANGGCTAFHDHSTILQDFGGPGSQSCSTAPHSGNVKCSALPDGPFTGCTTAGPTCTGRNGGGGVGYDNEKYRRECATVPLKEDGTKMFAHATTCDDMKTWGSTGAGAKKCKENGERFSGCVEMAQSQVGCVMTGPFAGWMSPEFGETVGATQGAPTTSSCLSRGVNWEIASQGYLTGSQRLQDIITKNDEYGSRSGFRANIESTPHANPHNLLGGHIRSFSSPADPLFFSHHAFIDKVWSMWQNCHDHDEIAKGIIDTPQYAPTNPGVDGPDDTMVFQFPGPKPAVDKCAKTDTSGCATCIGTQDSWCNSNNWDTTCSGFCSGPCKTQCGGATPVDVQTAIPTWYTADRESDGKVLPYKYHSIHDMPGGHSYLYAPDQFDLKMGAQSAICNYQESSVHGAKWKNNRHLMSMSQGIEDHPIDLHTRIAEASGQEHRRAAIEFDGCSCPSDPEDGWSTEPLIEYDADGNAVCGVAYTSGMQAYTPCFCTKGMFINEDGTKCISFMPTEIIIDNPDMVAMLNYYDQFSTELMNNNKFVKPADSLKAVMSELVKRECQLLYNEKTGVKRNDDVKDKTTVANAVVCTDAMLAAATKENPADCCKRGVDCDAGSLKFNFLKNWGLTAEIDAGIADDPCAGIGCQAVMGVGDDADVIVSYDCSEDGL